MNLLHPLALAWLALAIPIVIFYILKIRMRRVPVSTNLFWRQIFEEKQPRSIWQKLRHLLSLLVQLAILLLFVFALTNQFFLGKFATPGPLVLVIDNSASMNASDVENQPSRLAKAKEEALAIIDGIRFRDEMAIIAAGTQPTVRCGMTGHQSTLRNELAKIAPTDGPTRVKEAVELGRRLLSDRSESKTQGHSRLVVLTDGGFEDATKLAEAADLTVIGVGSKATGNVGITQFQVRRSLIDPIGYQILVELVNASDKLVETRLEIDLDDSPVDVVPLQLEPGKPFRKVFEKTSADGGRLVARINLADNLLIDNHAWAILPKREIQPVTLVSSGNLFLEKVFEANPLVRLTVAGEKATNLAPGIAVFHKIVPAKLPPGPVLVIEPTTSTDLWTIGEVQQNPIVTRQDKDSPLMAHVKLENVLMPEARQLTITAPRFQVLASSLTNDPLYAAINRPEGKVLVLTVNLEKGDLPLQTAFPILMANALGWYAGTKGELRESLATGAVADIDLPASAEPEKGGLALRGPDGKIKPLPVVASKVTVGPLDHCGVWSIVRPDPGSQVPPKPLLEIACNLASRTESDLRSPFDPSTRRASLVGGFGGWPIWVVLSSLGLVLVAAEWFCTNVDGLAKMPQNSWFPLELTRPLWLLGLGFLPVVVYFFVRSLVDFARWQKVLTLACRTLVVVLLVLALAGLTLLRTTKDQFVVFAIDRSLSVGDDSRKLAEDYIAKAITNAGPNRVAYLDFAAEPGSIQTDRGQKPPTMADEKATNLAAVIEVAAAAIPPFYVPKIVVLSDGNQTSGDAVKAALNAGISVSTVPLPTRTDPEVQVAAVNVPAQVLQGEPFNVEVVIDSNHDDEGDIEVFRGPIKVVGERKKIKKGENRFVFRQTIEGDRLASFKVRTRNFQDKLLDNNDDFGLVYTTGKPRVLLIESDPKEARDLMYALEEHEIQVEVRPPQGMPDSLADLQNYECLILSNVPATSLTNRQMDLARTYVRDLGGGLIMLGGDQSFGLGGYYKTALEEILPVRSDFEKEKEKPSLAMILVIDKSGSMGGEKIELAKEAAKAAIELLGPNDKVGVIAFEGSVFWISEIHPCTDKSFVLDRVSTIEAGGGTNMAPAMEEAYEALAKTVAKLKHVILLTDGISTPGDFEGIAQQMAQGRITISTVGVGQGYDQQLLEEIARIGNGRSYFAEDPNTVPQIFAKETVSASKSAINEQPFTPQVVRTTKALAGLDVDSAPLLLGYVVTRLKPTSEPILASETGDPLLTWWRYGLGMSVAFTSDAKPRWAAEWLAWPNYGKFWAQVVRQAMRKSESKGVVVQVDQKDRTAFVTLDAIDPSGRFLNDADTRMTVIDDQNGKRTLEMVQTAPGRYIATFPTPLTGAYHTEFSQKVNGQVVYQQSRGLAVGYPDELRLRPTNTDLLRSVARVSGGVFDPPAETIFAPSDKLALRATPLWPYLLAAAALVFVFDVALRRIDFTLISLRRPRLIL